MAKFMWNFEKMLKVHTPRPKFYFIRIKQIFMLPFNSNSPLLAHFLLGAFPMPTTPHMAGSPYSIPHARITIPHTIHIQYGTYSPFRNHANIPDDPIQKPCQDLNASDLESFRIHAKIPMHPNQKPCQHSRAFQDSASWRNIGTSQSIPKASQTFPTFHTPHKTNPPDKCKPQMHGAIIRKTNLFLTSYLLQQ
jgi:hypothetical protein